MIVNFFKYIYIFFFLINKRERLLASDVKTQQQQKTNKNNKKNQLSKHNKAKSSHSPGPTTFSPAKSLA